MVFFIFSIPILVIAIWMLKKHLKMDYGSQTWHISGFYLLAFSGFILVNLGVVSYMWGEGEREVVYSPGRSEKTSSENEPKDDKKKDCKNETDIELEESIRDTVILHPYFYPFITQRIGVGLLVIPVVNKTNNKFYLFRTDIGVMEVSIADTKIVVNTKLRESLFITEKMIRKSHTWYGMKCNRLVSATFFIESNKKIKFVY